MRALGQRSKADELLTSALDEAKKSGPEKLAVEVASFQARYWAEDGRIEDAIQMGSDAAVAAERIGDALLRQTAQVNLASALRAKDPKAAEKILRRVAADAEHLHGLESATVYGALSDLLAQNGLSEEALRYAKKALEAARRT